MDGVPILFCLAVQDDFNKDEIQALNSLKSSNWLKDQDAHRKEKFDVTIYWLGTEESKKWCVSFYDFEKTELLVKDMASITHVKLMQVTCTEIEDIFNNDDWEEFRKSEVSIEQLKNIIFPYMQEHLVSRPGHFYCYCFDLPEVFFSRRFKSFSLNYQGAETLEFLKNQVNNDHLKSVFLSGEWSFESQEVCFQLLRDSTMENLEAYEMVFSREIFFKMFDLFLMTSLQNGSKLKL